MKSVIYQDFLGNIIQPKVDDTPDIVKAAIRKKHKPKPLAVEVSSEETSSADDAVEVPVDGEKNDA